MTRTHGDPPPLPFPRTNHAFVQAIFGDRWPRTHVTGFPGDPGVPPPGAWTGGPAETWPWQETDNNYYAVSLFHGPLRQAHLMEHWCVLGVDDVGPKVAAADVLDLLGTPTYRLETSPGNEQWGYVLAEPVADAAWATATIKAVIKALVGVDGDDPGMSGVTRYLRLPIGHNQKASYCIPGVFSRGFTVRLVSWRPDLKLCLDEALCARLGVSPLSPGGGGGGSKPAPGFEPRSIPDLYDPAHGGPDALFTALQRLGLITAGPRKTAMGWGFDLLCPWLHEHTDRATTGAFYVPGGQHFKCQHGHCVDRNPGDLRGRLDAMLREESGGLVGLVDIVSEVEFDTVDPDTVELPDVLRETKAERAFFARFVCLRTKDAFWDLRDDVLVNDRMVNTEWTGPLRPVLPMVGEGRRQRPMPPASWFLQDTKRGRRASGLVLWPDQPRIVDDNGKQLVNLWKPLDRPHRRAAVDDAAIKPWLDLFWHVIGHETPDAYALGETVLDWMAMVLGSSVKGGWQVLVIGKQGIGKDMILQPLAHTLGRRRWQLVRGDDLNNTFSEWLDKRLVQLSEIRQTTRGTLTSHDQMAKLKGAFDPGKEWLTINPKYAPQYEARNVLMGWLTSNEDNPLRLEDGDRRFLVLDRRCVDARAPAVYRQLGRWFTHGNGLALVAEWLFRRWETMPDSSRAVLTDHAPMTEAKSVMIAENEDPINVWLRRCVESDYPDPEALPDVVSTDFVTERLLQAQREGWFGGARVNVTPDNIGRRLAAVGCEKLNDGKQIRIAGRSSRVWCVRNLALYVTVKPGDLAKVCNLIGKTQQDVSH